MAPMTLVLAGAAENLYPARMQMALSLGWHIVFSCLGVAFPAIVLFAEWRAHKTGDPVLHDLAHTWAKAMGVLFAAGAVSGTLLTFEMGILWPGLMNTYGEIFGFPFVLEGFSFFIEAIFVGIYLFGWNRMSPRAHMLAVLPMILAGMAGTFFVVAANAWMNNPVGFDVAPDGTLTDVDPIRGMFSPSMPPQVAHMWIAAFMVVGFGIASVYAVGMLRGRRDRYHRLGMLIPLTVGVVFAPIQIGVGDWIANTVAELQPAKLAAMEAQYRTRAGAPLSLGGIYYDDELHYSLEVPYGLSLLIHHDPSGVVPGLEETPQAEPAAGQRRAPGLQRRWSAAARRCWRSRSRSASRGGSGARGSRTGCSWARSRCPGSPRWRRWRAAGSPRRSAASPGSCTATCAPPTR